MDTLYFSKSKFVECSKCMRFFWLNMKKIIPVEEDPQAEKRMALGNEIGDMAMGYFGPFVETTTFKEDGKSLDKAAMIKKTQELIASGEENICEASFSYKGLYCAVDILHKVDGGYEIYEVKSTTSLKPYYKWDVAYQKYVLENCGITIKNIFILKLNENYYLNGKLDKHELFVPVDYNKQIKKLKDYVPKKLTEVEDILKKGTEPEPSFCTYCRKCPYYAHCIENIPSPSIMDINAGIDMDKKDIYVKKGKVKLEDIKDEDFVKDNPFASLQVKYGLGILKEPVIDKPKLKKFINGLTYPLYFLDFETFSTPLPKFQGTKCYQQLPFLYSLHWIEKEGGELKHTQFMIPSGADPRRPMAESLVKNIPTNVCVLAYNMSFEKTVIKNLAKDFSDLRDTLMAIHDNIKDLEEPFLNMSYYCAGMNGRTTIKMVLPALFPDDRELDYHSLEDVHNGDEASTIFPLIETMPKEEADRVIENLYKYCELDTLAMVKIYEKLKENI